MLESGKMISYRNYKTLEVIGNTLVTIINRSKKILTYYKIMVLLLLYLWICVCLCMCVFVFRKKRQLVFARSSGLQLNEQAAIRGLTQLNDRPLSEASVVRVSDIYFISLISYKAKMLSLKN